MAKLDHTYAELVGAALIVSFGHEFIELYQADADEEHVFVLRTREGQLYSVAYGDVYDVFGVRGHKGDYRTQWEAEEDEDAAWEKVWELETEYEVEGYEMTNGEEGYSGPNHTWGLGGLATFLYDLREGKING